MLENLKEYKFTILIGVIALTPFFIIGGWLLVFVLMIIAAASLGIGLGMLLEKYFD